MAFDQSTRNRLQKFVSDARGLLSEEFTRQLQNDYGLDPHSGTVTPVESLGHLDDTRRETARILRDTLAHYLASSPSGGAREALDRIVREQAFTVLNRLAALRMAESRGILIESVGNGYQSKGFQLYERLAGPGLGETGDTYRCYLFSIFDEFALDLKVLFDRFSPQGRLFPRETALLDLLKLLNDPELAHLWAEDESIGWVYQYFNSKEERKKMRDESAAPRNSRELAVRNQFFTPRYVVEFLTDNTLGRIWYEMTQGETGLKESCRYLVHRPNEFFLKAGEKAPEQSGGDETFSQEELLKQPVYIQPRLLKDPRTLRMLDPACGSMHFGLYAFDLYEQIYDEAWELELRLGSKAFVREDGLNPLTESYSDKVAFLRDVPRLIIEHNIHGIDIDPRAAQIAGLSLWLRAQRSWHNQGVKPVDRPRITRSNIVCAEPMPGEKELLREFTSRLEVPALGYLVEQVFDKMQLAGEAGSLLKIEEEIRNIIAEAKRLWKAGPKLTQMGLFGEALAKPEQIDLPLDFTGITDERFWESAEEKLYQALQDYAEAAGEHGYQRRLFAEDSARGFAFIDLFRKRYDVVVMNPPFGEASAGWKTKFEVLYPVTKHNLYGAFIEKGVELLTKTGLLGAITSRTGFFLTRFERWRQMLLDQAPPVTFADLGYDVLDNALVETAAYCLQKGQSDSALFVRLLTSEDKASSLKGCITSVLDGIRNPLVYCLDTSSFKLVPGNPFAYWVGTKIRNIFATHQPFGTERRRACITNPAGDDQRYFRCHWEVSPRLKGKNIRWAPITRGGKFNPFYDDVAQVVDWDPNDQTYRGFVGTFHRPLKKPASLEHFFKPGLTWPLRGARFSAKILPSGCIFSVAGKFATSDNLDELPALLGLMNSSAFDFLLSLFGGETRQQFEVGLINKVPVPPLDGDLGSRIGIAAIKAVELKRKLDNCSEVSHAFIAPTLLPITNLTEHAAKVAANIYTTTETIAVLQAEIDDLAFELYELNDLDRAALILSSAPESVEDCELQEDEDECVVSVNSSLIAVDLLAYDVGCIFGRWDIRLATGEKAVPELHDPFDSLPVCPPGMLQNVKGFPAELQDVHADYPLRITWPGILVDDEGHNEDIAGRVREVIEVIWKEKSGDIEHEACEILGVRSLRDYFSKPSGFFADHLKRYSKSRRQAPIYWPLSTPSGSYTLWLYYHRLTDQSLYTCVMEYVEPKLRDVAAELTSLRQKGSGRNRDDEKKLEKLQDFEAELQEFRDELLRLAHLPWKPNLNDGVQITAAPLWKLFQLPKWKKTLKETWEKLEKGDYDWAHLAYSIWPDRVKKKCVTDKSLAIAHDLEDLYVEPPASAKKKKGKKTAVVEDEEE
jgi:hypothetical protein